MTATLKVTRIDFPTHKTGIAADAKVTVELISESSQTEIEIMISPQASTDAILREAEKRLVEFAEHPEHPMAEDLRAALKHGCGLLI